MTNPAGNGYRGTVTRAASGRACIAWTDVKNYTISATLTVDDISKAKNYCRRVSFTQWNGPSCVTVDEAGMVRLEQCNVPYCGTDLCIYVKRCVICVQVIAGYKCILSCNNLFGRPYFGRPGVLSPEIFTRAKK